MIKITLLALVFVYTCIGYITRASSEVSFNGFLSQSVVHSTGNAFFEEDTGVSTNFREFGINASWQANAKLRFAAQLISRRMGDIDNGDPKLDFGLVDYTFYSSGSGSAGIRLGRIKNAYGLYNKTRDVPHARPGTVVPRAIYFESLRDALLRVDGGNFYLNLANGLGDFAVEAYFGDVDLDGNVVEYLMFQEDTSGNFDVSMLGGGRLEFTPLFMPELLLAYSAITTELELEGVPQFTQQQLAQAFIDISQNPAGAGRYATSLTIDVLLHLASVQYSLENWVFTTEFLRGFVEITNLSVLNVPSDDYKRTLEGYYIQAEWQANDKWSFLARYEDLVYDTSDRKGKEQARQSGANPVLQYTNGFTVGSRWHFTPDLSLTAEYGVYEGAATLVGSSSVDYSKLQEDWDLINFQLSFHF